MLWENVYDNSSHVPLVLQTFRGGGDATFTFSSLGGGYYQILNPLRNLVLACDSGDSAVYLETPDTGTGKQWSLSDEGGGWVSIINRLNGQALTVKTPPGTSYGPIITASNTHQDTQKYRLGEFRINPVQIIAVPPGWDTNAAKRIVVCSSSNRGSSITGTLNGPNGSSTPITLNFHSNIWGQYYYLYTDTSFAKTPGSYTVSVSGFADAAFTVSDYFYRATTDGSGGTQTIVSTINGFYAWQREPGAQTGIEEDLYASDGSHTVVGHSGDLHGGWKDATSTDIETTNDAEGLRNLAYAAEDSVVTADRNALLAEVAFGAGYFVRLQNSNGSFPVSVEPDSNTMVFNVDCGITARAVIGLAAASRALKGYNDTLSGQCLTAAAKGWTWVKGNLSNYITSNNIYQSYWWGNADSVLGAAVELAVTSPSNSSYQTDAANFFNEGKFNSSGNWVKQSGSYIHQASGAEAVIGLSRYYQTLGSGTLKTAIASQLTSYYNTVPGVTNTAFGTNSSNFGVGGFGGNSGYSNRAVICLNLYMALGDSRMLNSARDYMNWMYGANPFGSSFITAYGNLNCVPQYARPRPGSVGEILPGIVGTSSGSLTTWNGSDYGVGEGGIGATSMLTSYIALVDRFLNIGRFETESLTVADITSGVSHRVLSEEDMSNGGGTILDSTASGQYVTYLVPAIAAGSYDIRVGVKNLNTRGIWQLAIGQAGNFANSENNLGTAQDGYAAFTTFKELDLGTWTPASTGDKWFRFMITGKNASSTGFTECFDYIKVIPR